MNHQVWLHLAYILLGLALSAVIGAEREVRHKSAGLRTHALVGAGAALFMVVSKYGFADVLHTDQIVLDPSRVAAQIVSGIGFLGGGLIFVRRDAVRGLTTAAGVWLGAAVGAAAGAGLVAIACGTTAAYLLVVLAFPPVASRLPHSRSGTAWLRLSYADGRGLLREIVRACTTGGYQIADLDVLRRDFGQHDDAAPAVPSVDVLLELTGPRAVEALVSGLSELPGVVRVAVADDAGD